MKKSRITKAHKEIKFDESVNMLNDIVCVRLAPSSVHGIGVVAIRDIEKGKKLYLDAIPNMFDLPYSKFKRKLRPEIQEILLGYFPQIVNGSHFMYPVTRMAAFLNHSNTPNYDAKEDVVLVDIKAGEEIFEDYRQIEGYEKIFTWLVK